MMNYEMMVKEIKGLGEDAFLYEYDDELDVTLNDFEGFDEDWEEIDRDYDNEEAVNAFLEMLERECESKEGDFYVTYHFNGFNVKIGYGSFDI